MMQTESVTTPFGRRPISLDLVRRQQAIKQTKSGKTADKWKVLRDASAAMEALGVQSNSLAVLDALLSFYPENELREDAQLVVFPSNLQLSLRAHAMPGSTLRRHLAVLVEAGLIIRRDSANGKRFSRKDEAGNVEQAFGFDLSPLLLRSEELALLAQDVIAARLTHRKTKEKLTICRRDVRKLLTAAIEEGAEGDWQAIELAYVSLISRLPRNPTTGQMSEILDEMEILKGEILNHLEVANNAEDISINVAHIEHHIQNSNTESIKELEPRSENEQGATSKNSRPMIEPLKAFPLSLVLKACPQVAHFGPGGAVSSWRELMSAAVVIRSMLGVSPSAYQEACEILGAENAAVVMACILERANLINSAGAYLRDLTRRAERGEFSIGPMVMAALKANGHPLLRAG